MSVRTIDRPDSLAAYRAWLAAKGLAEITDLNSNHYEVVSREISDQCNKSSFWLELKSELREINDTYKIAKKEQLVVTADPKIVSKPFNSILDKTFRKNVINNPAFPDAPEGGWYLPNNWIERLNDVARTTIVVRYLDGVDYLSDSILKFAESRGVTIAIDRQASSQGYYAIHLYYQENVSVRNLDFSTSKILINVEVQITTQLKDVIKSIMHKFYTEGRSESPASSSDWQWDYKSDKFVANNLGHIIHYVDGMIVQLRDKRGSSE